MFSHYLQTALRHFRQHRLITAINVLCLALGLTCFIVTWGLSAWLHSGDQHQARAARTFILTKKEQGGVTMHTTPWLLGETLRTDMPELEAVARVLWPQDLPITADRKGDSQPTSTFAAVTYADPQFLRVFDLPFLAGDAATALDQPHRAIISEALALRLFGTRDVVGRVIRLSGSQDNVSITGVIGSIPQPSHISTSVNSPFLLHFEAMLSATSTGPTAAGRRWDSGVYLTYAVLPREGSLNLSALNARLEDLVRRHVSADQVDSLIFRARPIADFSSVMLDSLAGNDKTGISSGALLQGLGVLVLLIAGLNYANLATAQAATHSREVAMRRVVGANRYQLMIQHVTEALMLTSVAFVIALTCVSLGLASIGALRTSFASIAMRPGFWLMLVTTLLAVSVCVSAYPALVLSRIRPANALRAASARAGSGIMTTMLVGVQFGSASLLMIVVFVMLAQDRELQRSINNPSDDPLLLVANDMRAAGVDRQLLKSALMRMPGIASVSGMHRKPWTPGGNGDPLSASAEAGAARQVASYSIVDHDFFATMNIALRAGRDFARDRADDVAKIDAWDRNDPVAAADYNIVVDSSLLQRLGLGEPAAAIGKTIYRPMSKTGSTPPQRLHIIGVVDDAVLMPMTLGYPSFYMLNPERAGVPVVRISRANVSAGVASIDAVWKKLAPQVPLKRSFADEQYEQAFQFLTLMSSVLGTLAGLASFIAVMGLIAMALQVTRRRNHEIGVRKTLGASVTQILLMLLGSFSKPVIIANLAVWPLVYLMMRGYLSLFARSTALSPAPFIASLLITLLVACLAVVGQATRAARLKPATVLRYE